MKLYVNKLMETCFSPYFNHVPKLRVSLEHILNVFRSQIFVVQCDQNRERDLVALIEDFGGRRAAVVAID